MLKNLINKIIMGTKCYIALKDKFTKLEEDLNVYQETIIDLQNIISGNKTKARKIVRAVNGLIKKDEIVNTQKEIKEICNQIIKG